MNITKNLSKSDTMIFRRILMYTPVVLQGGLKLSYVDMYACMHGTWLRPMHSCLQWLPEQSKELNDQNGIGHVGQGGKDPLNV